MKTRKIGESGLEVSEICLGTMTWGSQNDAAEAHAQIDRSVEAGVTIMDAAEMYPTTPRRDATTGRTEEIIGEWYAGAGGRREKMLIATKIAGPNGGFAHDGRGVHPDTMRSSLEASLRRLGTDRIDLYQLHWPNRGSYHFRQNWDFDPTGISRTETEQHMADVLGTAAELRAEGKLREIALSNETAWGTAKWLEIARRDGLPRMASIQNEYSLLCRLYDTDLAELSVTEDVPLLCYSPLAAGLLTGKYRGGAVPEGSRQSINSGLGGRMTDGVHAAVEAYANIAEAHGLDLAQMALAFCMTRPFMGSTIIGATTPEQLETALGAADVTLTGEVMAEIGKAHRAHPLPY
ncbi:aldo/keto reductase [Roseicyclus sp. F158]|uniref:Aldo/keto reductase n=1 Tax=Tropicimonas omnivorans TaxID=3075590 RepID=A0ABU3DGK9_9RHOB|nr:aldo/keto reductase [Roseicyclus sp. F158]MDT0682856.1 aldo/keto reductase [Roseicyclus sp. F158]